MNPFSTLVGSIKLMQTKKDLRFCIANLCDELPVVSKIKRWATSGKLILFYNAGSASQRDFGKIDWILPFDRMKILIRACWLCRDLSHRRVFQYLLEILPCRSIDPQVAAWASCWLVALDGLRSCLVRRLVSLSIAWGTVECPFTVLATIKGLPDGIYFVLHLISRELDLAGAWITCWGHNNNQPWLTWLTWQCIMKGKKFLQFYHENLQSKGQWAWGIFSSCRMPLWWHLEGHNCWSWQSTCDQPSGLSAQLSAAAIAIFCMEDWPGGVIHGAPFIKER